MHLQQEKLSFFSPEFPPLVKMKRQQHSACIAINTVIEIYYCLKIQLNIHFSNILFTESRQLITTTDYNKKCMRESRDAIILIEVMENITAGAVLLFYLQFAPLYNVDTSYTTLIHIITLQLIICAIIHYCKIFTRSMNELFAHATNTIKDFIIETKLNYSAKKSDKTVKFHEQSGGKKRVRVNFAQLHFNKQIVGMMRTSVSYFV